MNNRACKSTPFMNHHSYNIFFTNLANPLKIGIILCLRHKDRNVSEIVKELRVEQSKISHALTSLKNCKIVDVKQKGKERVYSLNKETILPMFELIDRHSTIHCNNKCCFNTGK
ncbi:metalloregulator ArsR/SmtB family transcription factor [Candidatus Pacearchaeota archaeon]|nr:metalloregulator ArsR/SmtB family transcription factor [Candidatus Pacearchaeota archaeon]